MKAEIVDIQDNLGTQAIEIPAMFKINDDKVYLKKTGNIISIIPYHNAWQNLQDSLDAFTPDFMEDRAQPEQQNRKTFD